MDKSSKIYVAGHTGMVGSAIVRLLQRKGYTNTVTRSRSELDLTNQSKVQQFFNKEEPEYVLLAAAKVGGIMANKMYPAQFIYDNLMIQTNVIESAWAFDVSKLLFLGSSCIYPALAPQPIKEESFMTGPLEPTNEAYAIAKIAGIKMCQAYRSSNMNFISAMPTNLYGTNDNYDLDTSHVIPALLRKFQKAVAEQDDIVYVWGSGTPVREFMHVDDLADACLFLMQNYNKEAIINVGTGVGVTISELAHIIKGISGFKGEIAFDRTKPDGTPKKVLDVSRMAEMGWTAKTALLDGLKKTYELLTFES